MELGQSEATQALSWLPSMPTCIAVGTGVKWLRIYDLRRMLYIYHLPVKFIVLWVLEDITAPKSVIAHSRSINGVSFDPFNDGRLLTFSEDGIIKLWDIRKLAQPVRQFYYNITVITSNYDFRCLLLILDLKTYWK